uniref:acyl-CoA dehydrogenase C-terminal domain-containing protein n=1 Tax=Nocardia jejuensis TaxID=328049 RepID=UPI000AF020A8
AIQAQDFFFRKIIRDKGVALAHVAGLVQQFIDGGPDQFKGDRALLGTALADVQAMAAALTGYLMAGQSNPDELYKVGLGSVRFLYSVGDLVIGWRLLEQAAIAQAALDGGASDKDKNFYLGKVAIASWFARNKLPLITGVRSVVENLDDDIMKLDEAAF